ncbi:MAG: IS110 family RNA-guided transposase, partial [Candidatus Hodarchaeales archaeon]
MAKRQKNKTKQMKPLHVIQPNAAGIDIGATEIYVAVPNNEHATVSIRCFATFTEDLINAAKWMKGCGIKTIAMESTGVYWIPVFQILEAHGLEVALVNARHVKNVPGRKTDVQDCQWLQYLHSVGLLRGSYRPAQEVCAVRSLLRHRDNMVKIAVSHVQHMQKALTQMNLQIHHVISDITGVTGLAILDSILNGERNPKKLASLRDKRIKADEKTIIKALKGDYRSEHIFTLKQALQSYRHYRKMISDCDVEIEKYLREFESRIEPDEKAMSTHRKPKRNEPDFDLHTHMYRILGTDLTQIDGISTLTTHLFFSEVGPDISKFPTVKHFCSWLGLSPN